ncbi:hypothetical protein EMMF5_005220 [Cystobasidiomycetes sp. EMM_F5]
MAYIIAFEAKFSAMGNQPSVPGAGITSRVAPPQRFRTAAQIQAEDEQNAHSAALLASPRQVSPDRIH